jgi:hypothetical protein
MALSQVGISVCNDGNVSQLDVTDVRSGGPYYRIEVYRASQPIGGYGVTLSGSRVEHICAKDHLRPWSNQVFRYTFALGDEKTNKSSIPVVLEGREEFNPEGSSDGSWDVRLRDLDPLSPSYGSVIRATVSPLEEKMSYRVRFDLRPANPTPRQEPIFSPIGASITALNPSLPDLGSPLAELPGPIGLRGSELVEAEHSLNTSISGAMNTKAVSSALASMLELIAAPQFERFRINLDAYEAFGDFGSKAVHPGTNLIGPNVQLASESIFVRQYRSALVLIGRISSPDMARGASEPRPLSEVTTNTRPGVYANFVGAAINNIGIYKLGLDKVHSDYGGVPMRLAPGSRLETGASPVRDAWRCNQTLGEVAKIFFLGEPD